uniref:Uncharacterized protein n=1 Tax=Myoviridae sp. ctW7Z6 TaxID=2826661 RepID=A0A8S5NMH1_9CAUD|nr:MAG TPA: hypothetical protein [Myoviridae sp. ctW7Z6]
MGVTGVTTFKNPINKGKKRNTLKIKKCYLSVTNDKKVIQLTI